MYSGSSRALAYRLAKTVYYTVEQLERRTLLAAVSWDGGGDGTNWNDPINWSTDAGPGSADDATGASGRFTWANGTENFSGGAFIGPVYVSSGSLSVAASAGAQTILVAGSSTLLNNLSTSATVWVQGNNNFSSAQLAIGSITNN